MARKQTENTATLDHQPSLFDGQWDTRKAILVKGARVHNLKNITVAFPRNRFIVVTGVSGSGKSSLTIDTLYAEGQRRYAESLSAYARQFLTRMDKPDVDVIKGICPAIAIEQKVITRTPRSTVGSLTELYDFLRLLFARIGKTFSPISGKEVKRYQVSDVVDFILQLPAGSQVVIGIPFRLRDGYSQPQELQILLQKGFSRLYVAKDDQREILRIEEWLDKKLPNGDVYVLIDRLVVNESLQEDDARHRLADSVQTAFYEAEGACWVEVNRQHWHAFSNRFEMDGIRFEDPVPQLFSYNSPYGACPVCEGFGHVLGIDPDLVIPDKQLSVYEGAIACWRGEKMKEWNEALIRNAHKFHFPIHKPIAELTPEQYELLWKGNRYFAGIDDFFKMVEENLYKIQYRVLLSRYRGRTICPSCKGSRLRKEALYVKIGGCHIAELMAMPVAQLYDWFEQLELTPAEQQIAARLLHEIRYRLQTLLKVGLGYLTLDRPANTLSGGESQRIQLTRSLGSNLTDSLYILDEPSIGLHPRDTHQLIEVLKELRDLHNTVIVVEHDEQMMKAADYIVDMGPLASHQGGEVVFAGTYEDMLKDPNSLTGAYLSGRMQIPSGRAGRPRRWTRSIRLEGCREHNLKQIDVEFPLQVLCVVSGVSGSGKSTLVSQILYPALKKWKGDPVGKPGWYKALKGDLQAITQVELVDQQPIGKSSRSNPVTYIKAYDSIRNLFAAQPLSRIRGYQARHFSFNVDGGRCDRCKGEGEITIEMQFLADVHLTCEVCHGKRFKEEILEVTYQGKNIHDVLNMSVDEAIAFFAHEPAIVHQLQPLHQVGLGYIKLGQPASTLSGGEAQRVKLASFLGQSREGDHILFIFDEPTTGLHFHDIAYLLQSFDALIEQGHSIIVIEHNLDIIRRADWVIELGPEGGDKGGELIFAGTPDALKQVKQSYTARFL
ncbi:MAG: excinuclease ABC subunit UvrA [Thermoflavifilum sp.]|nr:excinuclease ABC subunit UvrA [Thermoflavifilum sp.]